MEAILFLNQFCSDTKSGGAAFNLAWLPFEELSVCENKYGKKLGAILWV